MLSIGRMGKGQEEYYLGLSQEDYYLQGGEPPGKWWGRGAAALELTGVVERDALQKLFRGFAPDGRPLTQNAGKTNRRPGWDLSFSAPKSVSVLWSQAEQETRRKIQTAHDQAVRVALSYIEEVAAFSRIGKAGTDSVPVGLIVAIFEHGTSRALDPQLHSHCLVINAGVRDDGTTGTVLSQPFYDHKMVAGAIYRAELAAQLSVLLGLSFRSERTWFEVLGVPELLSEFFSKRRAAIQEKLSARGLESASAAAFATLSTRDVKEIVPPRNELFADWREGGKSHKFSTAQAEALVRPGARLGSIEQAKDIVHETIKHLLESQSHFSGRELLRSAAECSQISPVGAMTILSAVRDALKNSPEIVIAGEKGNETRYTTREVLRLEQGLIESATRLSSARNQAVDAKRAEKVIEKYSSPRSEIAAELKHHAIQLVRAARKQSTEKIDRERIAQKAGLVLSEEQKEAVRSLTATPGRLKILSGMAGTGKTSTLAVCRELWEAAGYRVIGAAVAGKAARELEQGSGIKSKTLASTFRQLSPAFENKARHIAKKLWQEAKLGVSMEIKGMNSRAKQKVREAFQKHDRSRQKPALDKKTVLVVDEAGMIPTRDMAKVLQAVEKSGATLVFSGDGAQLQPIGAGGPFASLEKRLGASRLENITRQREERDREIVKDFARGDASAALKKLREQKLVTVAKDREKAIELLVSEWSKREAKNPERSLIFVGTNQEANDINRRCQEVRARMGLTDPSQRLKLDDSLVFRGDRVLFTKNSPALNVNNGDIGTVSAIDARRRRITVSLSDRRTAIIPLADYVHEHGSQEGKLAVRLGYCTTTHKGQGATTENAYMLAGGPMQHRELSYVQGSRAKGKTYVFTDLNEAGAGLDRLAASMSKSRAKELAIDLLEERGPSHKQELRLSR